MNKWTMKTLVLLLPVFGLLSTVQAKEKSIVKIGGDVVVVESEEVDDAVAVGGDITVNGTVNGNAVAVGGSIHLGQNAVIRGDAVSIGGTVHKEEEAVIHGDMVEIGDMGFLSYVIPFGKPGFWEIHWAFKIVSFIGFLVIALFIILLLPNQISAVARGIEKDVVTTILYSVVGVVLIVPLAISLAISVIGIPLIPLEILAIILAMVLGYIAVAQLIGTRALASIKKPSESLIAQTFSGLVILAVVGLIPFIGLLVKGIVFLIGFGGVITAVVYKRKGIVTMPT